MRQDFFSHINADLNINVQFVGVDNIPIEITDTDQFYFYVAKDLTSSVIQTLSLENGIEIIDSGQGTIAIKFSPQYDEGFGDFDLYYQLVCDLDSKKWVALEGKIFISPSLLD